MVGPPCIFYPIPRDAASKTLSGRIWTERFPTSTSIDDLHSEFRKKLQKFLDALGAAKAKVTVSATYRPPERAYLMHYAWEVARGITPPDKVPYRRGVEIEWAHRSVFGQLDLAASRRGARDMVLAYRMAHPAVLHSQHTRGMAVDMTISWDGQIKIQNASGKTIAISSMPHSGSNDELIVVGASYGVIKLKSDPPHWSANGH